MLTRELIANLLELQKRKDSLFSLVPTELLNLTGNYAEAHALDISKALKCAVYARQEDVDTLLAMLEANPALLLEKGNVITPGGDALLQVTIYECLLGAGDYELAARVYPYFAHLEGGEEERMRQYKRYQPFIENMLKQKPYNLSPLIQQIKTASPDEIRALLNKDLSGNTPLCKAIIQFHKDWAPRILREPCMHYNYNSLKHAFEILELECNNLYQASGNYHDKTNLVWRLIGFEMRRMPGIDRCAMAQSLFEVIQGHKDLIRTYTFKKNTEGLATVYPITDCDDSLDGLGGDFSISIFGEAHGDSDSYVFSAEFFENLMSNKNIKLSELHRSHHQSPCVIF